MRSLRKKEKHLISIVTTFVILAILMFLSKDNFQKAYVTRVVDGDTIKVQINAKEYTVRLIGINTPETNHPTKGVEPYGKEAKRFTTEMLTGKSVWLEFDAETKDRYGRLLAYMWLEKPNELSEEEIREKMFNAILLLEGYAQVMTVPPNVKYAHYFVKFQREAISEEKGLWSLDYYSRVKNKK
jgi:micrococcal nuclease